MREDDRITEGSSFGAAAAEYALHRPDYPIAALRWALDPAPGSPRPRVLDLGAGTGKLTAGLVELGVEVTAVEPDPGMLATLASVLPGVRALQGHAEAIPLPDACVDAVLVGQALHWFDKAAAGPEIARVLVPGGVLAGLWNFDDDREEWVAGLERASRNQASSTVSAWHAEGRQAGQGSLDLPGPFGPAEVAEFPHGQRRTIDSLLATIATHSRLLIMDDADRADLLSRIRGYLSGRPETATGEFILPLVTGVRRTRAWLP